MSHATPINQNPDIGRGIVLVLHGLNTYGDRDLHLGPIRVGPMQGPLVRSLSSRLQELGRFDISVRPAIGQGGVPPAQQAENVLRSHPELNQAPSVLIGHSTGGLTARIVARALGERVRRVITIGTPHHGTELAEHALRRASEPRSASRKMLELFGYDLERRSRVFASLTPESLIELNQLYPHDNRITALVGLLEPTEVSWPLRALPQKPVEGDGLISLRSQRFGPTEHRFRLDHLGQMGYHFYLTAARRREASAEFDRLIALAAELIAGTL